MTNSPETLTLPHNSPSLDQLASLAREVGIECGADVVIYEDQLAPFLGRVALAGGTFEQVSRWVIWKMTGYLGISATWERHIRAALPDLLPTDSGEWSSLPDSGFGAFDARIGEHRCLVVGIQESSRERPSRPGGVLLLGASRAAVGRFLHLALLTTPRPRVLTWGGGVDRVNPPAVEEGDVILPGDLKRDLLDWLDRFWKLGGEAERLGLPLRRGLLLVGHPGTGKTQLIRHLLTRFPDAEAHLFLAARQHAKEAPFDGLRIALEVATRRCLVILEDIDRIAESGAVTPEYLLGCLDGLLALEKPILWIATSNDPTRLEANLLDRPGRFDRVVVLPAPAQPERRELLRRFSKLPIGDAELEAAALQADGLSGAHLREAVTAATLSTLESGREYGQTLNEEIDRMGRQHQAARELMRSLRSSGIGFGAGEARG